MKLYSYNQASESAKALSVALGIKRIKHEGKPLLDHAHVINWGASTITRKCPKYFFCNNPNSVAKAVNKLTAFGIMGQAGVTIPNFTANHQMALGWLAQGQIVVTRHKLNGHSGEGIVITAPVGVEVFDTDLEKAPLYVQYIKKTQEYRCHVMHGEVFFIQRKARKLEIPDEEVNWQVRNLAGGFIYANQNVELPEEAQQEAIMAVEALGLDFGAVDIILGTDHQYYVLEVNCAPGLAGTTLDKYVEQFKRYV
jgi:glutathione synthase/RimK-type ligase-like ATP-grasp enzyme